jgi:hypothetical protein
MPLSFFSHSLVFFTTVLAASDITDDTISVMTHTAYVKKLIQFLSNCRRLNLNIYLNPACMHAWIQV